MASDLVSGARYAISWGDGYQFCLIPAYTRPDLKGYPSKSLALNAAISELIELRAVVQSAIRKAQKRQRNLDARVERQMNSGSIAHG